MRCATALRVVAGILFAAGCNSPQPEPPAAPAVTPAAAARGPRRHVLLTIEVTPAGARLVDARRVAMPLPRSPAPRDPALTVDVLDARGASLHATRVPPPVVRGEFARADRSYERVEVAPDTFAVAVRVPDLEGAARVEVRSAPAALSPADSRREKALAEGAAAVVLGSVAWPRDLP